MKNLLIVFVVILLSCKDKDASPKNTDATIAISGLVSKIENNSPASISENINIDSSEVTRTILYKGTLNGTINISLYLNEQEHPCGGNLTILNAMYKYDNQDKWILLNVTTDLQKKNYCMVEDRFTGVLLLEEHADSLIGSWISPDSKKQFKVELESERVKMGIEFDESIIEKLDEILFDELLYGKNDC